MEELRIWVKASVLVIITLIVTVGGCNVHMDYRIAKAIEQGNDPILARLAFESDGGQTGRMMYVIAKAQQEVPD